MGQQLVSLLRLPCEAEWHHLVGSLPLPGKTAIQCAEAQWALALYHGVSGHSVDVWAWQESDPVPHIAVMPAGSYSLLAVMCSVYLRHAELAQQCNSPRLALCSFSQSACGLARLRWPPVAQPSHDPCHALVAQQQGGVQAEGRLSGTKPVAQQRRVLQAPVAQLPCLLVTLRQVWASVKCGVTSDLRLERAARRTRGRSLVALGAPARC